MNKIMILAALFAAACVGDPPTIVTVAHCQVGDDGCVEIVTQAQLVADTRSAATVVFQDNDPSWNFDCVGHSCFLSVWNGFDSTTVTCTAQESGGVDCVVTMCVNGSCSTHTIA
jgi:hypothetical protein